MNEMVICFLNSRFPFDWKNPTGFIMVIILLSVIHLHCIHFIVSAIAIGASDFLMVTTLTKEIKSDLFAFGKLIKSKPNPVDLFQKLFDILHFHSTVKRCMEEIVY